MTTIELVNARREYAAHLGVSLGVTTAIVADPDDVAIHARHAAEGNINGVGKHPIPLGRARIEARGDRYFLVWT